MYPHSEFYPEDENYSNKNDFLLGMEGSYGHSFPPVLVPELLKLHNCIICYAVNGVIDGIIHGMWIPYTLTYDDEVAASIYLSRCQ